MKLFVVFALAMLATAQAGWFDDAKEWLSGAADTVGDTASSVGEWTKEKAASAGQWTKEKAEHAGQWTKETGSKVVDGAQKITWDDIVEGAKNAGQTVGDTANKVYNHVSGQNNEKK